MYVDSSQHCIICPTQMSNLELLVNSVQQFMTAIALRHIVVAKLLWLVTFDLLSNVTIHGICL